MAIYSLHHGNVGRATQAQPGTAGAHVRYITREGAVRLVMAEHMPQDRNAARSWMDAQELADRKNARVIDKVMVALPVELDAAERADLVRDFVADVTGGRTPWMAAIHDRDEDAHNPHAHIIIRDRDIETGKRAIGLSEKGSTERLREAWELAANHALQRAGVEARIDRRSLEDQGNAKEAGIHIGPNVLAMEEKGIRPESLAQEVGARVVNWPKIDQGRTRADRQREIQAANDLGRDSDDGREKGGKVAAGAPPSPPLPGIEPASETPLLEPVEARRLWAERLRALSAEKPPAPASQTSEEAPARVGASRLRLEPEKASQQPEQANAAEKSRLLQAIERGWEKLAGLANRLDAAFQRIVHREPDAPAERRRPEQVPHRREAEDRETPPAPVAPAAAAESAEEKRKRRYAELLAEQISKRPPPRPRSGPTFGR